MFALKVAECVPACCLPPDGTGSIPGRVVILALHRLIGLRVQTDVPIPALPSVPIVHRLRAVCDTDQLLSHCQKNQRQSRQRARLRMPLGVGSCIQPTGQTHLRDGANAIPGSGAEVAGFELVRSRVADRPLHRTPAAGLKGSRPRVQSRFETCGRFPWERSCASRLLAHPI